MSNEKERKEPVEEKKDHLKEDKKNPEQVEPKKEGKDIPKQDFLKTRPGIFKKFFKGKEKMIEPPKEVSGLKNKEVEIKQKVEFLEQEIKQSKKEDQKKFFQRIFRRPKNRYDLEFQKIGLKALAFKKKRQKLKHRHFLRKYLDKAGFEQVNEMKLIKRIFHVVIIICLIVSFALLAVSIINKPGALGPTLMIAATWTGVFAFLVIFSFFSLYLFLDLRIFNRTLALEAVLPDFLQLTSANISAGMPMDRALWFAVRPQFGILSKEIEQVAKSTIAGEDLGQALKKFSNKYDSAMLKRSVDLIVEGLEAGGEIAELLNKIAINIQDLRLMKREMAANVTTYVIFIVFASVLAAPFLFALSTTLAIIIQKIVSGIDTTAATSAMGFTLNFNANAVDIGDFKLYCVLALLMTSIFSASIINVIRRGSIRQGIKFIPIFMIITTTLYFFGLKILEYVTKGMFSK